MSNFHWYSFSLGIVATLVFEVLLFWAGSWLLGRMWRG